MRNEWYQTQNNKYMAIFVSIVLLQEYNLCYNQMNDFRISTLKRLKLSDFQIGRTIGRGGSAKIKLAKNKRTGKFVALKQIKKRQTLLAQHVDHVYNQINIHSQISHQFIVNFQGLAQDSKQLYLVQQLVNGGDFFSYLRLMDSLPTEQCKFYAANVILAIEYLHSKDIVYRDLKPENLLIGNDGYLKLADFGFSKFLKKSPRTYTVVGTPNYMAPEVILNKGHGKAVDWWALGVFVYEMHTGIDPFGDDDVYSTFENILNGKVSFPPSIFDKAPEAKRFIKTLLVEDLHRRKGNLKSGLNDLKKSIWLGAITMEQVLSKSKTPPYVPIPRGGGQVDYMKEYYDSLTEPESIKQKDDVFANW